MWMNAFRLTVTERLPAARIAGVASGAARSGVDSSSTI
jgi:hypothetical protein